MSRNVLVTGGAGYIGAQTCKALAARGLHPVVYDNLSAGHHWAVRWGPLVKADLMDYAALDEAFRTFRPSSVIHFAAHAYVGESVEQPLKYYKVNVTGMLNLLEVMLARGVEKIVFSSSCATYGSPALVPISESQPQNPINPYGASKLVGERLLVDFQNAYGMRSISLRYFNAAGADPDYELGEEHDPETHLIPLVLLAAKGERPNVTIFGADYDTPDGTCIRDYVHVADLAEAHALALEKLECGGGTAQLNLGTGAGYSIQQVIQAARATTGRQIPVQYGPRRPGDPPRLVADASQAKLQLGWRPEHSQLSNIIATAWQWMNRAADSKVAAARLQPQVSS